MKIEYDHTKQPSLGILLLNLGTPDSASVKDVKKYLQQFLSDPRVIEAPALLWKIFLHGVVLNTRPKKSTKAYQSVWTDQGSPLMSISQEQQRKLQKLLPEEFSGPVHVALGMRYGSPSIESALQQLRDLNAQRILVLSLYPQYSATTVASTFDEIARIMKSIRWIPELRFINQYHDHPQHIRLLANSVLEFQQQHGKPDRLLMSFHGIPREYFLKGDPYYCQCQTSARLLAEELQLNDDEWKICFQSRVGPKEWLTPYTAETLKQWPKQGITSVQTICPGFPTDCLETLEEMAVENRDIFLANGGKTYHYIESLNASDEHIGFLATLIKTHTQGWPESSENYQPIDTERLQQRVESDEQYR